MKPLLLGVNIDHVATLRQARGTRYPDPVHAALAAEQAGADSITIHLREDRRHIQDRDLEHLSHIITTHINLELAITDEMLAIAVDAQPRDVCLVPERREELTTEGGLDVVADPQRVREAVNTLSAAGIRVSLFVDPDEQQIEAAKAAGAPVIELHTGQFADAVDHQSRTHELARIEQASRFATNAGLVVNAGHGLNYHNVQQVAAIEQIVELNIGHAIVARALFTGFEEAVREMKRLMLSART